MIRDGDWEAILALAHQVDSGVAAGMGIEPEEALRLAHAILAFEQQLGDAALFVPAGPSEGSNHGADGGA
jgi:hypothetical protein